MKQKKKILIAVFACAAVVAGVAVGQRVGRDTTGS